MNTTIEPIPTRRPRRFLGLALGFVLGIVVTGIVAAALLGGDTVHGNGVIRKQERTPGTFTGLELGIASRVDVRIGTSDSVSIEGDENLLALISSSVEGGTLQLRPTRRNLNLDTRNLKITVTARDIQRLGVSGAGDIHASGLRAPKLRLEIGGSGSISSTETQSDTIEASIGGSGDIKLDGTARKLRISIAGSGDLEAPRLKVDEADVRIAGSGTAVVWAVQALRSAIAGSGDVRYWGDPTTRLSVAGSGDVKRLGAAPL